MLKSRRAHRVFKTLGVLLVCGVLGIGALIGGLSLEHRSDVTIPPPTGTFAVGRSTYDWVDEAHVDSLAPAAGTKRELLVTMWYPAVAGSGTAGSDPEHLRGPAPGLPAGTPFVFRMISRFLGLLTRDWSRVHRHSRRDADVAPQQRSYPVAIMRAGASAGVMTYSTLAEYLAGHGYVVVGFDAPYRTARVVFPDGRVIVRSPQNNPEAYTGAALERIADKLLTAWTADIGFVLDELERLNAHDATGKFKGRLNMTAVGVFGHSFGGATAALFCAKDSRCKAGIDVDGSLHGSVIQTASTSLSCLS